MKWGQVKTLEGQGVPLNQAEVQNSQDLQIIFGTGPDIGQSQGNIQIDYKLRQAENNKVTINVNPNGSGDFMTITEAINSIPAPNSRRVVVFIAPGLYREKIVIPRDLDFITFLGDATKKPIITGNDRSSTIGSDGEPLATFKSATVAVDADYFIAINIVFENTASPRIGSKDDQAVALRVSGNKCAFYNSDFYGFQDTLYDHKGLHYFKGCKIQGTIDFIFGNGRSLYQGCTINSIAQNVGFITAQKRSSLTTDDSGFSILNSKVIGSGQVYLGRPWGDYSRVIFSYTYMDNLVLPQGWVDTMDDGDHHLSVFYAEYKCTGPGSNFAGRLPWIQRLSDKDAQEFIGVHFIYGETWLITSGGARTLVQGNRVSGNDEEKEEGFGTTLQDYKCSKLGMTTEHAGTRLNPP
ncbi:putative pectinesterase 63 [Trifolium pratense]|uniref:putative pectinesterase 63 n=1 Tax=Trifolium pratense TaxID=57577 RepID=UPI001E695B19|nr:putative pectinesterase 63 [Trifolium pratense]